jgi:hypothetical protein
MGGWAASSDLMFYPSMTGLPGSYAAAAASSAENAALEARTEVELYRHDLDRLLLITEALWFVLKQEHGYTDDVLIKLIQELEQRKTTSTGVTLKDPPVACPVCQRPNTATRIFCLYCGKPMQANPFAR